MHFGDKTLFMVNSSILLLSSFLESSMVILAMIMICLFMKFGSGEEQFIMEIFSISKMSIFMVLMSLIVFMFMVDSKSKMKKNLIYFLMVIVILFFTTDNLLMFFILFESSLIPIYLMIIGWGYQPERLMAGSYMMIYTVFASIPFLFSIILFMMNKGWSFFILSMDINMNWSEMETWMIFLAFFVKLPVFFFHAWLPKAHVEASMEGSIILASVLLKLGMYGFMKLYSTMLFFYNFWFFFFFSSLGLVGSVAASVLVFLSDDMKKSVAYSSIGHMNYLLVACMIKKNLSFLSCILTMMSHGMVSVSLFNLATIVHKVSGSRSMSLVKGVLSLCPALVMISFFAWMVNMAAPPSASFIGEVTTIGVLLSEWPVFIPMFFITFILFSFFNIFMFCISCHCYSFAQKSFSSVILWWLTMNWVFILINVVVFFFVSLQ